MNHLAIWLTLMIVTMIIRPVWGGPPDKTTKNSGRALQAPSVTGTASCGAVPGTPTQDPRPSTSFDLPASRRPVPDSTRSNDAQDEDLALLLSLEESDRRHSSRRRPRRHDDWKEEMARALRPHRPVPGLMTQQELEDEQEDAITHMVFQDSTWQLFGRLHDFHQQEARRRGTEPPAQLVVDSDGVFTTVREGQAPRPCGVGSTIIQDAPEFFNEAEDTGENPNDTLTDNEMADEQDEAVALAEVEEPAPTLDEVEEPAPTLDEVEEPAAALAEVEEPATALAEVEEPVTALAEAKEPVTAPAEVEEPVTALAEVEEPVTALTEVEEPAAALAEVEEPVTALAEQVEEPVTTLAEVAEPAAASAEVDKPVTALAEVGEPVTALAEGEEPAAARAEANEPLDQEIEEHIEKLEVWVEDSTTDLAPVHACVPTVAVRVRKIRFEDMARIDGLARVEDTILVEDTITIDNQGDNDEETINTDVYDEYDVNVDADIIQVEVDDESEIHFENPVDLEETVQFKDVFNTEDTDVIIVATDYKTEADNVKVEDVVVDIALVEDEQDALAPAKIMEEDVDEITNAPACRQSRSWERGPSYNEENDELRDGLTAVLSNTAVLAAAVAAEKLEEKKDDDEQEAAPRRRSRLRRAIVSVGSAVTRVCRRLVPCLPRRNSQAH